MGLHISLHLVVLDAGEIGNSFVCVILASSTKKDRFDYILWHSLEALGAIEEEQ